MADVVHVKAPNLTQAAATVAQHIEIAATPASAVAPHSAPASPVDVATSGAAGAIHTKMTALSTELAPKGPAIQQAGTAAAASLHAQDTSNASRISAVRPAPPRPRKPHIQAVDRTWKRDPAPNPNDPGTHPQFPDHKPDGTWARGNSGADGYPEEQQAFDDREKRTGIPIERQKVRVTLTDPTTGKTLTREYDGLEPIPGHPGEYLGLEHKLGGAQPTPNQRVFDGLVKDGVPARGTLNGKPIEVTDTETLRTPHTPADGSAPIISPPPNLPNVLDHPPAAPAPVDPAHPAPAPIPPTVLDHPPVPPWLKDPSPPGFHVSPSEPPDFAPLDTPGGNLPTPQQHGQPFTLHMPDLQMPNLILSPEQLHTLENEGLAGILGLILVGAVVVAVI
jgi:hypothetical protein